MTSQTGKQIITINILPKISKSKSNQSMKFGQLIECNMRNIYLGKSYTKYGGGISTRTFFKISKLDISLDQHSEILYGFLNTYIYIYIYII